MGLHCIEVAILASCFRLFWTAKVELNCSHSWKRCWATSRVCRPAGQSWLPGICARHHEGFERLHLQLHLLAVLRHLLKHSGHDSHLRHHCVQRGWRPWRGDGYRDSNMAICGLGLEGVEVSAGLGRTFVGEEGGNCPSWRARSRRERCTNTGHHGLRVSLASLFHTGGDRSVNAALPCAIYIV